MPVPRLQYRRCAIGIHAGAWQLRDGPDLSWTEGNNWRAVIELPGGTVYEYKYVLLDSHSGQALTWQRGNNSVLAIKAGEESIEVGPSVMLGTFCTSHCV